VVVLHEDRRGREHQTAVYVVAAHGESAETLIGRAATAFRTQRGFADRVISVDLYPQD
jgi:hypothetical protein